MRLFIILCYLYSLYEHYESCLEKRNYPALKAILPLVDDVRLCVENPARKLCSVYKHNTNKCVYSKFKANAHCCALNKFSAVECRVDVICGAAAALEL